MNWHWQVTSWFACGSEHEYALHGWHTSKCCTINDNTLFLNTCIWVMHAGTCQSLQTPLRLQGLTLQMQATASWTSCLQHMKHGGSSSSNSSSNSSSIQYQQEGPAALELSTFAALQRVQCQELA